MKKTSLVFSLLSLIMVVATTDAIADTINTNSCTLEGTEISKNHKALLWYRTAAENKALFHQIFNAALSQINNIVNEKKLEAKSWGVIFALDGTLLDATGYQLNKLLKCNPNSDSITSLSSFYINTQLPATPGAADISCSIQNMGGQVVIVANRVGGGEYGQNLITATKNNLSAKKICYDNIIFAHDSFDRDKNPRFSAANSGDYENMITTKPLNALHIVAYIGSDIQDFPNYKQSTTQNLPDNNEAWNKFGEEYFIVPNPLFGSWQNNYLK